MIGQKKRASNLISWRRRLKYVEVTYRYAQLHTLRCLSNVLITQMEKSKVKLTF